MEPREQAGGFRREIEDRTLGIEPPEERGERVARATPSPLLRLGVVIGIVLIAVAVIGAMRLRSGPGGAKGAEPVSDTYTIEVQSRDSIHGFLTWIGLVRTAPPEAVAETCIMQSLLPLGVYQRADGRSKLMCYGPNDDPDPAACAAFGLEMAAIDMDELTITCRRDPGGPGTRKSGA